MIRWCAFLLMVACLFILVGRDMKGGPVPAPGESPATAEVQAKVDRYGDPFPAHAVGRIGSVRVWQGAVHAIALSPDGRRLAFGGDDKMVRLWDVRSGKEVQRLRAFEKPASTLAFSPSGALLAAVDGSRDGTACPILLWEVGTGKKLRSFKSCSGPVCTVAFAPDGKTLASGGESIRLWDIATGVEVPVDRTSLDQVRWVGCTAFSPDGKTLRLADFDGHVVLYDLASRKSRRHRVSVSDSCRSFVLSPDGKTLGTADGEDLVLWDVATGRKLRALNVGSQPIFALAPDGKTVAWVGYGDQMVHLVELATGKETVPFTGHQDRITCLAFSANGKVLASGSEDGTVLLWDATGRLREGAARSFNLSPDEANTAGREAMGKQPVPADAQVSLVLDKDRYFLGENVLVHFCVRNAGIGIFHIELGGDYRGASRHLRFSVTATDERGKEVPDPDPSGFCMGGVGGSSKMLPGEKHYESLPLLRYRRFEKPGVYKLRASHDLGWTVGGRALPVAEATITFVMPTAEQARGVVEEMYRLQEDTGGTSGERQMPYADFTTLAHPVYLPFLAPRAAKGCKHALEALGAMPTPEATKVLVNLLGHQDSAFARTVVQTLNRRLPDPQLEGKLGCRNPFDNDQLESRSWLVSRSWRAEFEPAVRKVGRRLLERADTVDLWCGAFILECLGQQVDVPALVKALDRAAIQSRDMPLEETYPRPRGACQELMRAASMMGLRGVRAPSPPRSPGEMLLFAAAIGANKSFRPPGWQTTYARLLRAEIPYVREAALVNLPLSPPDALLGLVPGLLMDKNVDVQIAACGVAEKTRAPRLREPVLRVLATAREEWLLGAANRAADELSTRWDHIGVLVSRLDEKGMTARCLNFLASDVLTDESWGSIQTADMLDVAAGRACKAAWQQFLRDHEAELKARRSFRLADPALPLAKLFPGYTFDPPKKP